MRGHAVDVSYWQHGYKYRINTSVNLLFLLADIDPRTIGFIGIRGIFESQRLVIGSLRSKNDPTTGLTSAPIGGRSKRVNYPLRLDTDPCSDKQLGGSNEDGETFSSRLRRRACCGFGNAGCRSSGQGQTGRIREDLLTVRRGLLLHSGQ